MGAYTLAQDVSLLERNTLRVDARADWFATVHRHEALPALLDEPALRGLPLLVLGEGSNVLFAAERFEGVVVHLAADSIALSEIEDHGLVRVEAACNWDALVDWTLERGLQGLENLALIPGHTGAAPIQNIGAYGVEVGEYVVSVDAYDLASRSTSRLGAAACEFGYRDSLFKREHGRWIVTALELRLPRAGETRLGYAGLREELAAMGSLEATPRNVAEAVRRVRRRKLPDPAVIGNAGSFFKNPIVPTGLAESLGARLEGLPVFPGPTPGERKLSAAWLIERAGWRGYREDDAGVSARHALVLVNHGHATGAQLIGVARRVADSVLARFGVRLEPEPRIVGGEF